MTDRAKKISELQATTSVANTDKLVVLKDPSGTPLTRSITVNAFTQSVKASIAPQIPGAVYVSNTMVVTSNNTEYVNTISFDMTNYDAMDVIFHANEGENATFNKMLIVINNLASNSYIDGTLIGGNPIIFDSTLITGNTVTILMKRQSASTANVSIKYTATLV